MAHIINRSFSLFLSLLFLILGTSNIFAQALSDKERHKLVATVNKLYCETSMQGSELFKIGKKKALVSIVGVKKTPNSQRVAQLKAARSAGEFLQAASNKSVTVYEVIDKKAYTLNDSASESGHTTNSASVSNLSQEVEDVSTVESSETFSDKIIQSSLTRVKRMEPLCNLGMTDGELIFAYFTLID